MEHWLEIPEDRKTLPVGRLCLIMGLMVLVLLAVAGRPVDLAGPVRMPVQLA